MIVNGHSFMYVNNIYTFCTIIYDSENSLKQKTPRHMSGCFCIENLKLAPTYSSQ